MCVHCTVHNCCTQYCTEHSWRFSLVASRQSSLLRWRLFEGRGRVVARKSRPINSPTRYALVLLYGPLAWNTRPQPDCKQIQRFNSRSFRLLSFADWSYLPQMVQHCRYLWSSFLSGVRQLCLLAKLWRQQLLGWPTTAATVENFLSLNTLSPGSSWWEVPDLRLMQSSCPHTKNQPDPCRHLATTDRRTATVNNVQDTQTHNP